MPENGSKTPIVVALISLIGVLGAAVISNADKLSKVFAHEPPPAAPAFSSKESASVTPAGSVSQPVSQSESQTKKPAKPHDVEQPPEQVLLGHWVSTVENSFFSVIDISQVGKEVHVRAYVNNHGPDGGGCVYDATLDRTRGVVAHGKNLEWQLPTLALPCANWAQPGFTAASLAVVSGEKAADTLATVVDMFAGQKLLGGSGPVAYIRK